MSDEKPTQYSKPLTRRQRDVLQLLAEGATMRQAAGVLGITAGTVAYHKYHIMEQFHLDTNTDLVRLAIKNQLVPSFVTHPASHAHSN